MSTLGTLNTENVKPSRKLVPCDPNSDEDDVYLRMQIEVSRMRRERTVFFVFHLIKASTARVAVNFLIFNISVIPLKYFLLSSSLVLVMEDEDDLAGLSCTTFTACYTQNSAGLGT